VRVIPATLAILLLFRVTAADAAAAPATRTTTATAPSGGLRAASRASKEEPPDPLITAAVAAVEEGELPSFVSTVEGQVADGRANLAAAGQSRLITLATAREFARYFVRVRQPTDAQRETLKWLIRQPRLGPTLMMAVNESDPPDRLLQLLTALRTSEGDRLDGYADLTAAFCVVWDAPERFGGGDDTVMDEARLQRLFRYYPRAGDALRYGPRRLPWELLVFAVDNSVAEAEIDWARSQYPRRLSVGAAFQDVAYNPFSGLNRDPAKRDDPMAYNLANLRRHGGNLADGAHFAAHVGKSFGIPTVTFTALEKEGREAQHWVGYFQLGSGRSVWNVQDGRHREHVGSIGVATDPQSLEPIGEGELMVLCELPRLKTAAPRLASVALVKLADGAEPKDAFPLVRRAVDLSPGNRRAWLRLGELAATRQLTDDQMRDLNAVVAKYLKDAHPQLALAVRIKMINGLGVDEQLATLEEAAKLFRGRNDLLAQIRLVQGEYLAERGDSTGALKAYGDAVQLAGGSAPSVLVDALDKIDDLLRGENDLARLVAIYKQVWTRMPRPSPCPHAGSTAYYAVGAAYATLLDELDQAQAASAVRAKLTTLLTEGTRR
jgi:hypothetical protein